MTADERAEQIRARLADCEDEEGTADRPLWWLDSPAGDDFIRNAPADLAWLLAERDALLALVDEARMEPGRWWRALDTDGDVWCESSQEEEVREMMRPTDRVQRLWESTAGEWRDEK